jgi:hypothetical protein
MATKKGGSKKGGSSAQVRNPLTKRWVKVSTKTGRILSRKGSPGPYKGIKKR